MLRNFELRTIVIKIVIYTRIYKMCQTTCHQHDAATKMDSEFDSSVDLAMNSLDSPAQGKQVETLMVVYGVPDVIAVLPIKTLSHMITDQEILPKMAYILSESISACRKWVVRKVQKLG